MDIFERGPYGNVVERLSSGAVLCGPLFRDAEVSVLAPDPTDMSMFLFTATQFPVLVLGA